MHGTQSSLQTPCLAELFCKNQFTPLMGKRRATRAILIYSRLADCFFDTPDTNKFGIHKGYGLFQDDTNPLNA